MTWRWLVLLCLLLVGCGTPTTAQPSATLPPAPAATLTPVRLPVPPILGYEVITRLPHDRNAFTQGLVLRDGKFYEGTGLYGRSSLRRVEPTTGVVEQQVDLAADYFGEGITIFGEVIYQITWQENTAFTYDRTTFEQLGTFRYEGEGWGLTDDGTQLIMSNGTPTIAFRDPATFAVLRTMEAHDPNGIPAFCRAGTQGSATVLDELNELEYIDGVIWANVWQRDCIAQIDPSSGRVIAYVDLRGLLSAEDRVGSDVLNGIAYDPASQRLFITGKLWPWVFEVKVAMPTALALPLILS